MNDWQIERRKIIGLGENSFRKSYYPDLQDKIDDLQLSTQNLQSILNSMNDAIIIHDFLGKFLYLNSRAFKLFNIKDAEFVKYSVADISASNMNIEELSLIWQEVPSCNTKTIEWVAQQIGTKKEFPVQISFNNVYWYDNSAILVVVRDFTEQKLAEETLRKSQILLKACIESPKDMIIFSIDRDYNYLIFNQFHKLMTHKVYGLNIKQGTNMLECMSDDDRIKAKLNFDRAFSGESHTTIEMYGLIERYFFETRYNPIFNGNNEIVGATAFSYDITYRVLVEEKLRETNAYLENIINSANTLIVLCDKQFRITRFNPYSENLTGFTEDEVKGKSIYILFPPQNKTEVLEVLHKTQKGERLEGIELEILNKDNTRSTILWNMATIFEKDGTPMATIVQGQDITNRKRSEEELRKSELSFSSLFKNIQTGIVLHGTDTQVLMSNPTASELLGLSTEQMKGKAAIDPEWNFINENNEVLAIEAYPVNRVLNEKMAFKNQILGVRHPNTNDVVWVSVNGFPIINELGELTEIVISFNDITERKLAEESLKLSEEKYRMLSENFAGGISIYENNKVKYISEGYVKIFGYDRIELENISFEKIFSFIHKDDVERVLKTIQAAHDRQKKQIQYSFRLQNKQGNFIWIEDIVHVEYDASGNHVRSIIYSRDITERKQAEEKIRQLNEELELRVNERTKQLETANKQLAIENAENAKRAVELNSINKELETFSYSVSHDLRAPLRHIIGFGDMLTKELENKLSDAGQHYFSVIIDAAKKMGILIDDLLNFSKTSRIELRKSPVDMNQIIDAAKIQLQYPLNGSNINWQISKLPIVLGDFNLLLLVWVNLLDNALKYSSKREEIIIKIDCEEDINETVFSVSDNGVGFDMQYASKLFGLFQRLHSSSEFEGTGIGLANVQRIIGKHGGRTWAKSEVDKGATFYFSLPKS